MLRPARPSRPPVPPMPSLPEHLLRSLQRARWRRRLRTLTGDPALADRLMELGVVADRLSRRDGFLEVTAPPLPFPLRLPGELFALDAWEHSAALVAAGARFERAGEALRVRIDDREFEPITAEEILILREVFVDGAYHWNPTHPTVVWDIGANVGTASLFFAGRPEIRHVHAFEPLSANRARFERHLALNPGRAAAVTLHPFAVGAVAETLRAAYAPRHRGSFSLREAPSAIGRLAGADLGNTHQETIRVIAARDAFAQVAATHPDAEIVAKVDCEGAEREILPALAETGLLARIRTVLAETHQGAGPSLAALLGGAGFDVLLHEPRSRDLGFLVAVNRRPAPR